MSRITWEEERVNYECDGCGYIFGESVLAGSGKDKNYEAPVTLIVRGRSYHFHNAIDHKYPCFKYWLEHKAQHGSADILAALTGIKEVT